MDAVQSRVEVVTALNNFLDPVRERRAGYEARPGLLDDILAAGNARMAAEARDTVRMVEDAMGMTYFR